MILVLTGTDDEHADRVVAQLRERGAAFVRFDPAEFPRAAEISMSYSADGQCRSVLRVGETQVELASLRAAWYRRPGAPQPHAELTDERARAFAAQQCTSFAQDLWSSLDCRWLPAAPATTRHAQHKASQLGLAGGLGFELPPTLISNSAADLLDFYRQHHGHIVSKLAAGQFSGPLGNDFVRYTEVVSRRAIAHARDLRYAPMIFQAYVPKRIELRITVVGRQVFAAEIHSQTTNHTRHDWRRYDEAHTPHFAHQLPRDLEDRCIRLTQALGLCYGAIDMVLTPDGRYVFIEINPNGQYLWIEQKTGLPISDAICNLLMAGTRTHESLAPAPELSLGGVM